MDSFFVGGGLSMSDNSNATDEESLDESDDTVTDNQTDADEHCREKAEITESDFNGKIVQIPTGTEEGSDDLFLNLVLVRDADEADEEYLSARSDIVDEEEEGGGVGKLGVGEDEYEDIDDAEEMLSKSVQEVLNDEQAYDHLVRLITQRAEEELKQIQKGCRRQERTIKRRQWLLVVLQSELEAHRRTRATDNALCKILKRAKDNTIDELLTAFKEKNPDFESRLEVEFPGLSEQLQNANNAAMLAELTLDLMEKKELIRGIECLVKARYSKIVRSKRQRKTFRKKHRSLKRKRESAKRDLAEARDLILTSRRGISFGDVEYYFIPTMRRQGGSEHIPGDLDIRPYARLLSEMQMAASVENARREGRISQTLETAL